MCDTDGVVRRHRRERRRDLLEFGIGGEARLDNVRTCLEERILPEALTFAAKIDRMNEDDIGLDKANFLEQARQLETSARSIPRNRWWLANSS